MTQGGEKGEVTHAPSWDSQEWRLEDRKTEEAPRREVDWKWLELDLCLVLGSPLSLLSLMRSMALALELESGFEVEEH